MSGEDDTIDLEMRSAVERHNSHSKLDRVTGKDREGLSINGMFGCAFLAVMLLPILLSPIVAVTANRSVAARPGYAG